MVTVALGGWEAHVDSVLHVDWLVETQPRSDVVFNLL